MLNFAMIWPGSLASLAAFQGAFMPCGLLFPSSSFAGTNANFTNSASLLTLPALLILWLQLFSHSLHWQFYVEYGTINFRDGDIYVMA